MKKESLRSSVDLFKAMAHPVRLRILSLLREEELCVCQITEIIGLAFSTISEHLCNLRRAGAVLERKEGRWVFYALNDEPYIRGVLNTLWPAIERGTTIKRDLRKANLIRKIPVPVMCKALISRSRQGSKAKRSARKSM